MEPITSAGDVKGKSIEKVMYCLYSAPFELNNQLRLDEKMYTCYVRVGFKKVKLHAKIDC